MKKFQKLFCGLLVAIISIVLSYSGQGKNVQALEKITPGISSNYRITEDNAIVRTVESYEDGNTTIIKYYKTKNILDIGGQILDLNSLSQEVTVKSDMGLMSEPGGPYPWTIVMQASVNTTNSNYKYAYYREQNINTGQYGWDITKAGSYRPFIFERTDNRDRFFSYTYAVNTMVTRYLELVASVGGSGASTILAILMSNPVTALAAAIAAAGFGTVAITRGIALHGAKVNCDTVYQQHLQPIYGY